MASNPIQIRATGEVDQAIRQLGQVRAQLDGVSKALKDTASPATKSKKAVEGQAKATQKAGAEAKKATKEASGLTKAIQAQIPATSSLTSGLGSLGTGLTALGPGGVAAAAAIGGLTLGVTASIAAVSGAIIEYAELSQEVADLANQFGDLEAQTAIQADTLQGLSLAAKRSGADFSGFIGDLRNFSKIVGDAADGNVKLQQAFRDAGVSIRDDVSGEVRNVNDLFKETVDGLRNIDDRSRRAFAGAQLLGGQFAVITQVLGDSSIEEYSKRVEALGGNIDGVLEASQAWQAAQGDLEVAQQGVSLALLEGLNRYIDGAAAVDVYTKSLIVLQGAAQFTGEAIGIYITDAFARATQFMELGEREIERVRERLAIMQDRAASFGDTMDEVFGDRLREAFAVVGAGLARIQALNEAVFGGIANGSRFAFDFVAQAGGKLVDLIEADIARVISVTNRIAEALGLGPLIDELEGFGADFRALGASYGESITDGLATIFDTSIPESTFAKVADAGERAFGRVDEQLKLLEESTVSLAKQGPALEQALVGPPTQAAKSWQDTRRELQAAAGDFAKMRAQLDAVVAKIEEDAERSRAAVGDSFEALGDGVLEAGMAFTDMGELAGGVLGGLAGALQGMGEQFEALFGPDARANAEAYAGAVVATLGTVSNSIFAVADAQNAARMQEAEQNIESLNEEAQRIKALQERGKITRAEARSQLNAIRKQRRGEKDAAFDASIASWRNSLLQAGVNASLAATLALASVPPPLGFAAAAANLAAGGVQVGIIASNKPKKRHIGDRPGDLVPQVLGDEAYVQTAGLLTTRREQQVTLSPQAVAAGGADVVGKLNSGATTRDDLERASAIYIQQGAHLYDAGFAEAERMPGSSIARALGRRTGPLGHRRG